MTGARAFETRQHVLMREFVQIAVRTQRLFQIGDFGKFELQNKKR
jgi:hypothetical protein